MPTVSQRTVHIVNSLCLVCQLSQVCMLSAQKSRNSEKGLQGRWKKLWPVQPRVTLGAKYNRVSLPQPSPSPFRFKMASATSAGTFEVRSATVSRVTNETKIEVSLSLDTHPTLAPQTINVKTGIGFLDHVS